MSRFYTSKVRNRLSPRENEVTSWIVQGLSNEAIAKQMKVTIKTVKFHLTTIYKITGAKSRTELTAHYYKKMGYFKTLERGHHGKEAC